MNNTITPEMLKVVAERMYPEYKVISEEDSYSGKCIYIYTRNVISGPVVIIDHGEFDDESICL